MDYKRTQIPKRFWEKTLSDYKVGRGQGSMEGLDAAAAYIDTLARHRDDGTGLTFAGPAGAGKTMLACLIGQAAFDKGFKVIFMTLAKYYRLQTNLWAWKDHEDDEVARDWLQARNISLKIRNSTDLLLLDDVGKEHITMTHFAEDEFDYLLRSRFDNGLPTIMTTNIPVEEWSHRNVLGQEVERYGDSMVSFIHEAAPPIEVDTKDFRR